MRTIGSGMILAFAFCLLVTSAYGQEENVGPEAGDFSLSPQFALSHAKPENGDASGTLTLASGFGYFLTPKVELGAFLFVGTTFAKDQNLGDNLFISVGPNAVYHFQFGKTQRVIPFIGAGGGIYYQKFELGDGSDSSTDFSVGGAAGLDYYATESTSVRLQLRDDYIFADENLNSLLFLVGLNIIF